MSEFANEVKAAEDCAKDARQWGVEFLQEKRFEDAAEQYRLAGVFDRIAQGYRELPGAGA